MSKAEKTRQFIIAQSAPVFNIKGYENTSLSDIQEVTGLTKGSVYGNFADKNELAIAAYQYNYDEVADRLVQCVKEAGTAADKLKSILDFYRKNWKNIARLGGCPIVNAAVEADDHAVFLKGHVQKSILDFAGLLQRIIEKGQRTKEFKQDISAQDYAYIMLTTLEGGILLAKIMHSNQRLWMALDRIQLIVDQEIKL